MMAQIKQMQANVDVELEEEWAKLKMLQAQMDVNATRVRVYNPMEGNIDAEYDSFCGQNGASFNCK